MVPAAFVPLERLPLTPNGKVDRRALPPPDGTRPDGDDGFVAPQTSMEQTIARVWQEVLHVDKVGIKDNFFDLGGHSLLMTQLYVKLCAVLDTDMSLIDVFRYPTITTLAAFLNRTYEGEASVGRSNKRAETRRAAMKRLVAHKQHMQSRTEEERI